MGVGYEIFWTSERIAKLNILQSHNGYLDIYLNIGLCGLLLLMLSIVVGYAKTFKQLAYEYEFGILNIIIITSVVLYNWTEATYKPTSTLFVLLLFAILKVPQKLRTENKRFIQSYRK